MTYVPGGIRATRVNGLLRETTAPRPHGVGEQDQSPDYTQRVRDNTLRSDRYEFVA